MDDEDDSILSIVFLTRHGKIAFLRIIMDNCSLVVFAHKQFQNNDGGGGVCVSDYFLFSFRYVDHRDKNRDVFTRRKNGTALRQTREGRTISTEIDHLEPFPTRTTPEKKTTLETVNTKRVFFCLAVVTFVARFCFKTVRGFCMGWSEVTCVCLFVVVCLFGAFRGGARHRFALTERRASGAAASPPRPLWRRTQHHSCWLARGLGTCAARLFVFYFRCIFFAPHTHTHTRFN